MLAVASLLFLLLPFLLLTTSAQKLVGLDMKLPATGQLQAMGGDVEELVVQLAPTTLRVIASLSRTDVRATAEERELHETELADDENGLDLRGLQEVLRAIKRLAPAHARIRIVPADDVTVQRVVYVMDAVRADAKGPLFPEVALGGQP
jgi:biopolymer transport protein ExbD